MDWADCEQLLGKKPDVDLAKEMGCSARTISRKRKEKGIAPFSKSKNNRSDWQIDWPQYDKDLGTCHDTELATKIGCTPGAVSSRRNKLRIQKFRVSKKRQKPKGKGRAVSWTKWDSLLGCMPDKDLASRIGCAPQTVRSRRLKVGIKPFKEGRASLSK